MKDTPESKEGSTEGRNQWKKEGKSSWKEGKNKEGLSSALRTESKA